MRPIQFCLLIKERLHGSQTRGAKVRRRRKRHSFTSNRRYGMDWRRILPTIVLLAVFGYAAVNLVQYAIRSVSTKRTNEALQAMYSDASATFLPETPAPESVPTSTPRPALLSSYQYIGETILPESAELYAKNPDLGAWLRIPDVVSLPVVCRYNTYYFNHDFFGRESDSRTLGI